MFQSKEGWRKNVAQTWMKCARMSFQCALSSKKKIDKRGQENFRLVERSVITEPPPVKTNNSELKCKNTLSSRICSTTLNIQPH